MKKLLIIKEHDYIETEQGRVGTIIHAYKDRPAFEVEFEDVVRTVYLHEIERKLSEKKYEELSLEKKGTYYTIDIFRKKKAGKPITNH